jgi:hypothetical protein
MKARARTSSFARLHGLLTRPRAEPDEPFPGRAYHGIPSGCPECTQQDLEKVHNEILQIANQRFQLTTLALASCGTIAAWVTDTVVTSTAAEKQPGLAIYAVEDLVPMATLLAFLLLLGLFWYQGRLLMSLRWLSTYLIVQGSGWEWHWLCFRHAGPQLGGRRGTLPFHAYLWGLLHAFWGMMFVVLVYHLWLEAHFIARAKEQALGEGQVWGGWSSLSVAAPHELGPWLLVAFAGILIAWVMWRLTCKLDENCRDNDMIESWNQALSVAARFQSTSPAACLDASGLEYGAETNTASGQVERETHEGS